MPEEDLPPHRAAIKVEEDLPPHPRSLMLYAAGGGFLGALLALLLAWILVGPCCCMAPAEDAMTLQNEAVPPG